MKRYLVLFLLVSLNWISLKANDEDGKVPSEANGVLDSRSNNSLRSIILRSVNHLVADKLIAKEDSALLTYIFRQGSLGFLNLKGIKRSYILLTIVKNLLEESVVQGVFLGFKDGPGLFDFLNNTLREMHIVLCREHIFFYNYPPFENVSWDSYFFQYLLIKSKGVYVEEQAKAYFDEQKEIEAQQLGLADVDLFNKRSSILDGVDFGYHIIKFVAELNLKKQMAYFDKCLLYYFLTGGDISFFSFKGLVRLGVLTKHLSNVLVKFSLIGKDVKPIESLANLVDRTIELNAAIKTRKARIIEDRGSSPKGRSGSAKDVEVSMKEVINVRWCDSLECYLKEVIKDYGIDSFRGLQIDQLGFSVAERSNLNLL